MLKKIISIMLIVDIVSTCLNLSVSAAKYPVALTGWTASFYNTPDTGWTEGETGVELTTDPALVAHGKASLHLFCEKNLGNLYARAVQNVSGLASGKTYRLTGKVNASGTGWRYCLKFGSAALANIGDLNGGKINEWTDIKHDFEFTYDSKELTIHLEAGGDIYADNLSLREIISGEGETAVLGPELLTNGDFEMDFAAPEEAAFVQTAPANGVNYLNVKTDLGVKIYQKTDSGEQLLELGDPVYEKTNYNLKVYQHSGLINGQEYRYIVRTVGVNGKESEGTAVSATPLEKYNDYVRLFGWTYKNYNNNYGKVTMEQGKGIDGSTALQASNMTDSNANSTYLYITNQRGFTLESGKTYQLSYWEKDGIHNSMQDSVFVKVNNSKVSADGGQTYAEKNKNVSPPVVPADGTWHKQVLYLKPEAEKNTLELQLNRHYEQMLLDDFELYEVDEQLNVVVGAKNLMADCNGDFEDISDTKELAVSFRYYPAYSDEEHYGEIMDPSGISALKELAGYDTDVLRAEMEITNTMYRENKDFVLILAVYKEGILYEMPQSITATAAYGKTESLGFDYRVPDLATGEYSIKMFIWDGVGTLIPLAPLSAIEEN